jgi:hypothetical protein
MTPTEILIAAKDKISDEKNWGKGYYGMDSDGRSVASYSYKAVCWCSAGAINKVAHDNYGSRTSEVLDVQLAFKYLTDVTGGSITFYNDTHDHKDVMRAFDEAILTSRIP